MTKRPINPSSLFRSLDHGFPQAVVASGKRTLYVSGQTAWDAERHIAGGSDLKAQARQAFRNLGAVLEEAGATPSDVVFLRIYVVNYRPEDAAAVGTAFQEFFAAGAAAATTWLGVTALADPGLLIEIEAVAVLD
jgi:enamine deaminase RidA (YjgF/YER057c/UK114 family)